MNLKELLITFIIMLTVTAIVLYFAPLEKQWQENYASNNDSIEVQKDAERLELELKKERIRKEINLY